jgi:LysM repeat protein
MCGHDLRIQPRRRQRVSLTDALLVLAVLAVLVVWWRLGTRPQQEAVVAGEEDAILPTNIPVLSGTSTPTPEPTATPVPPAPQQTIITHEVTAGETLLSIASLYNVTVDEIQVANNLDSELIRVGDRLSIPVLRAAPAIPPAADGPTSTFEYTVRANDTIISIALTFGSTVDEILAANNLAANAIIRPGDRLLIPIRAVPQEVIESTADAPAAPAEGSAPAASSADVIYIAPRLIGPPDNGTLPRTESALLRWVSVDVLQPHEWYVLLLYPVNDAAHTLPSIWTKATSYRLPLEFAPVEGQSATYTWQVSVVRVKPGAGSTPSMEAASPPSELRRFTWQ